MRVLDALQEEMIESVTHQGWPPSDPDAPDAPQVGGQLPTSHAEVVDGELQWWFGERERPALRLPPVRIKD